MADEFVRRSFTRFRLGASSSLSISIAFLRVLGPLGGGPQILDPISGSASRSVAAEIRIRPGFDVRVGDILREVVSLRIFIVTQIQYEADANLFQCSEIRGPIPDEFNTDLEVFWTRNSPVFSIATDEGALELDTVPTGSHPSAANRSTQVVKGDFDVWATVRPDSGASNQRFCLIGARDAGGLGCYVGIRNISTGNAFVRVNQTGVSSSNVIVFDTVVSEGYVRIRRQGTRFVCFFSESEPITDADWFEIYAAPDAFAFESDQDVDVGCFGYATGSPVGQMRWQFFRNWVGVNESPTSINLLSNVVRCIHRNTNIVGNVGAGLDNLHSFSLPAGLLATDGDWLRARYGFLFATNDNDKRIQVNFGGQVAHNSGLFDMDTGEAYYDITYIRLSATSVRAYGALHWSFISRDGGGTMGGLGLIGTVAPADLTVSDLNANAMTMLVQAEGTSNDDIRQRLSIVELCQQ